MQDALKAAELELIKLEEKCKVTHNCHWQAYAIYRVNQSINQLINQSIDRSINQSINQLINQSIDQSIN